MQPVLSEIERTKLDSGDDDAFYDSPRFVTHADEGFLRRLTEAYASVLEPGDRILDAMSSWVSHLPEDVEGSPGAGSGDGLGIKV